MSISDSPFIMVKDAIRRCGHRQDYGIKTGGTILTVEKFASRELCSECKDNENNERMIRDRKAIEKAKTIMEEKGFMNCYYMPMNEGKAVEVILTIKV